MKKILSSNLNKLINLIVLILCLSLLFGCVSSGNDVKRVTGKKGLEIEFLDSTPDEVYEDSDFFTRLNIRNVGAYSIADESNPGFAALTTDKFYLQYDAWTDFDRSFTLTGVSNIYPRGDFTLLDLPEFHVPILRGNIQNPKTEVFISVCYPYQTLFTDNVCVDFDVYDLDERAKVCHAEERIYSQGQGAPVAITKIVPVVRQDNNKVIPEYFITVENVGNGMVAMPKNETDTCDEIAKGQRDLGVINLRASLSNRTLNCVPSRLKLIDDEVEFRCSAINGIIGTTNYFTSLTIILNYYYIESLSIEFDITRTMIYDPSIFIRDANCNDKEVGTPCFKDSRVCDVNGRCVDKCEFCTTHENSQRYEFCNNVGPDFSCSCSSDECILLGEENCNFGLCKNKQCCNYEPDKKGISYNSKKVYLFDEFS